MTTAEVPRYAVLFKTHFWDGFTQRQYARLAACCHSGDIFVVVDETAGPVTGIDVLPESRIVRLTEADALGLGLPSASTSGSLFWYSVDYPQWVFLDREPEHSSYDYYLTIEYDALIDTDIDRLMSDLARDEVDYLGHPYTLPHRQWPWFERHLQVYDEAQLTLAFSCIAVFSHRAMRLLRQRRLDMAGEFASGALRFWPNNEAFLPTEVKLAGLRTASLPDYGSTRRFDWWPPTFEGDLPSVEGEAFMHPVLEGERYVRSVLKHEPRLLSVLLPDSTVRSRLSKTPAAFYRPFIVQEFKRRLGAAIQRRLARVGLAQDWAVGAAAPKAAAPRRQAG